MASILDQHFTRRDLDYLESKNQDAVMIVRDRTTGVITTSKLVIPLVTLASYFSTLASPREVPDIPCGISEKERDNLPDTPGPIKDIFRSKSRTQSFAAELMKFWRGTLGKVKTGCGEFPAWNKVKLDITEFPYCEQMLERVMDVLPGRFQVSMADILEWSDLKGVHSLASGKSKSLKCKWQWLEWLKFFIVWSYKVCGKNIENCVDSSWNESDEDFETVSKKNSTNTKTNNDEKSNKTTKTTKHKSTEAEKVYGKKKGVCQAILKKKVSKEKGVDNETAVAIALSISNEIEVVRIEEQEEEELNMAIEESK